MLMVCTIVICRYREFFVGIVRAILLFGVAYFINQYHFTTDYLLLLWFVVKQLLEEAVKRFAFYIVVAFEALVPGARRPAPETPRAELNDPNDPSDPNEALLG